VNHGRTHGRTTRKHIASAGAYRRRRLKNLRGSISRQPCKIDRLLKFTTYRNTHGNNVRLGVVVGINKGCKVLTKCQTPLQGHRLRTCCTTPPTDKLTTILQLVVQQICRTSKCQSLTSRHVKMLRCGKFLSVGGEFVVQRHIVFMGSFLF